ncbi:glycosyltransferase [Phocaeicola sartorii]|jgi:glycosyltransferase involved in cell wall biosynthesis|uniref:glycosyltransferase n=1 Tax=Phocaeicola sartorii TaxID=671267 RepID=UPI00258ACBE2|nr:glycosyltransferase [Phocaeicola sartorii]
MNILFLLKTHNVGGIERVSHFLANYFFDKGHKVVFVSFETPPDSVRRALNSDIPIYILQYPVCSKQNINRLHLILAKCDIDFIINQWGLPYTFAKLSYKASRGLSIKRISVYHSCPHSNGKITLVDRMISESNFLIKRKILSIVKYFVTCITSQSMKYSFLNSDAYIVLSEHYRLELLEFIGLGKRYLSKIYAISNPLTLTMNQCLQKKEKEIIYVGRLSQEKAVFRLIDSWNLLEHKFPDWRLTIVGDGPQSDFLKKKVDILKLERVSFEGFQNPEKYYRRASVLCLTSEYEGFGLVVVEGMSWGVVPIVYGSYAAIYDIINSGTDGYILQPDDKGGFDTVMMKEYMEKLMTSNGLLKSMSEKAVEKSKQFSIDSIYSQWLQLFHELDNKIKV